jgi:uncharacterized protein (DUF1778 family)
MNPLETKSKRILPATLPKQKMRFTLEQQEQMIKALLSPPEPNDRLKEAAQTYQQSDITSQCIK